MPEQRRTDETFESVLSESLLPTARHARGYACACARACWKRLPRALRGYGPSRPRSAPVCSSTRVACGPPSGSSIPSAVWSACSKKATYRSRSGSGFDSVATADLPPWLACARGSPASSPSSESSRWRSRSRSTCSCAKLAGARSTACCGRESSRAGSGVGYRPR